MRHIEDGDKPMEAAYKGAGEIGFTIVSLTVSLIAEKFITAPLYDRYRGPAVPRIRATLTIAVLTSMVIALTLTPMMSGRLLRAVRHGASAPWMPGNEAPLNALYNFYRVTLDIVLEAPVSTLIVAALTLVFTITLYLAIPKGFLPDQDTGFLTATTNSAGCILRSNQGPGKF